MAQNSAVGHILSLNTKHAIYLHRGESKEGTIHVNSQNIIQQNVEEIVFGEKYLKNSSLNSRIYSRILLKYQLLKPSEKLETSHLFGNDC